MSREAILRAIGTAADREVEAILSAARAESRRLVEEAEHAAADRVRTALADREPMLAAESARLVNAARLRLLHARAARRAARVAAAFDAAERQLGVLPGEDPPRWQAAQERLSAMACAQVGSDGTLLESGPGIHARSADGRVEVDASVATRLAQARTALADIVVELLEA